jgi:LPS-assembly protein
MQRLHPAGVAAWACLAACMVAGPADAQILNTRRTPGQETAKPVNQTDPVAFTADEVQYDRDNALVTATGSVEAWQNDHVLRADKIVFDRNTNVAAATGHVVIIEPDGQVLFSDYAELTEGMREGVLRGMRAILAENGKLVANGARRVEGKVNELSRAVYTTCDLCKTDPTKPPLWQLRARTAVQDTENKIIEYRDAVLDIYGVPVAAFPYFWHADPSEKRASGFLVPSIGNSSGLGAFLSVPYYLVIDPQSDATITPTLNSKNGLGINGEYRRRFNDGTLSVQSSAGVDSGLQADIFAKGRFNYDDTWRYGFDIDRATTSQYLRDYRITSQGDILTSNLYVEGFGVGSYAKLDSSAYQSLLTSIQQNRLPYVLPRFEYSYFGEPDALGGRLSFDSQNFNVTRQQGATTQRLGGTLTWDRPFKGLLGEAYTLTGQAIGAAYTAANTDQNPVYLQDPVTQAARVQPQVALQVRWPFVRDGGSWGTQIIEPIAQVIAGPGGTGRTNLRMPNEDSFDAFNFSDANLFALNKFPGIDRLEGGVRANVAMHVNWTVGGAIFDGLVGQSFHTNADNVFPVGSGLDQRSSDIVGRATFSPTPWLDITSRARFDHSRYTPRFVDTQASVGVPLFRLTGGYIYNAVNPYFYYDQATVPASFYQHVNEGTIGANSRFGNYKINSYYRRDLSLGKSTSAGVEAAYEDECFIFDVNYSRRFTSIANDNGATIVLFQITLKTVGQFGFHAF